MKIKIAYAVGLLSTGLGALALAGCPETNMTVDSGSMEDAPLVLADVPMGDDSGRDAGVRRDTGVAACGTRGNLGGQCAAGECFEPWLCQEEVSRDITTISRADETMPGRPYPVRYWPGGQCQGACDPNRNGQCNDCSTCLQTGTDTSGNAVGECFQSCTQDVDGRGGCNDGYACDRANLACVIQCAIVDGTDTCQFSFEDRDTDPTTRETIVDEGTGYASHCNVTTGLCEATGRAGATAGDDCMEDTDCEDDGTCLTPNDPATAPPTLVDGYCIRLGCNDTDLACQTGDVCTVSLFGLPGGVCMEGCVVGAETTQAQVHGAATGHNPGCGAEEACFWDGVHGTAAALNGGCYPGNYNDIPAYNVGSECQDDEDCWSPYGLGRCLFSSGTFHDRTGRGICAVGGCGAGSDGVFGLATSDGVVPVLEPNDICQGAAAGNNDICVGFSETQTFCVSSCATAADCPSGYACPDLSGNPLRPLRLCWPACQVDADCHTGARCLNDSRTACNPDTDTCFCTDAMPAPDAGVVPRDAGTDAFVPADDAAVADDAAMTDDAFAG